MAEHPDRILTTHVGSLVRPAPLIEIMKTIEAGQPYSEADYERCLRDSVAEVVRRQAECGVDIVSDGEYGKGINWAFYIYRRMGGLEHRVVTTPEEIRRSISMIGGRDRDAFPEFYAEYDAPVMARAEHRQAVCSGPLVYTGDGQLQRDIANLTAAAAATPVAGAFLPVVAPASAVVDVVDEYYRDERKFLFAVADVLRHEYKAILDAGLTLQIDDAFVPYMHEKLVPPMTLDAYKAWAQLRIDALNHALEGLPPERIRYHICWGSWNGPHIFDVPMRDIVDLLLQVNAGSYLFEAANPRHEHEWRVWESVELPPGKILVPGVVSHATNVVEHPELIAERIVRLARIVGREAVMAGTDCGFAQSPFARRVHPSIMWAKLDAMAEGARLASAELWGRRIAA
jgi:5-methyltetrahydropteroyltriglutamate--homocysteine methyltransferase